MTNTFITVGFPQQRDLPATYVDDLENMRGRTRDRSTLRASVSKAVRPDESGLRGRSRQRAASPRVHASRNSSPSLGSILYSRLETSSRREHCPSQPTSTSTHRARAVSPRRRRYQGARSRSRNAVRVAMMENPRLLESQHSSLRNEVVMADEAPEQHIPTANEASLL